MNQTYVKLLRQVLAGDYQAALVFRDYVQEHDLVALTRAVYDRVRRSDRLLGELRAFCHESVYGLEWPPDSEPYREMRRVDGLRDRKHVQRLNLRWALTLIDNEPWRQGKARYWVAPERRST